MSHILKSILCLTFLSITCAWMPGTAKPTGKAPVDGLTITVTSATSVSLSWSAMTGDTFYTVTATDLSTNQKVADFTTTFTNTNISGLANGHNYQICVGDGSSDYIICEDTHM